MIAGMVDPSILGYTGASAHQMSSGADDHEFCHPEKHEKMMKQHQKMMGNMPSNQMPKNSGQVPMNDGQMKQNMPTNNQGHTH